MSILLTIFWTEWGFLKIWISVWLLYVVVNDLFVHLRSLLSSDLLEGLKYIVPLPGLLFQKLRMSSGTSVNLSNDPKLKIKGDKKISVIMRVAIHISTWFNRGWVIWPSDSTLIHFQMYKKRLEIFLKFFFFQLKYRREDAPKIFYVI